MTTAVPSDRRLRFIALHDKAMLTILRGETDTPQHGPLLVVFGSFLPKGSTPEFAGIVARSGRPALWVMEHRFDYYANPATVPLIRDTIRAEMDRLGCSQIDTLGFSMGAYAAVSYAEMLPVRYALAFAPRFSPDPAIVRDPRVRQRLEKLSGRFAFPTLAKGLERVQAGLVLHGMKGPDRLHIGHFNPPSGTPHWLVPRANHFVAQWAKQAGILEGLVRHVCAGDIAAAEGLLRGKGALPAQSQNERITLRQGELAVLRLRWWAARQIRRVMPR